MFSNEHICLFPRNEFGNLPFIVPFWLKLTDGQICGTCIAFPPPQAEPTDWPVARHCQQGQTISHKESAQDLVWLEILNKTPQLFIGGHSRFQGTVNKNWKVKVVWQRQAFSTWCDFARTGDCSDLASS
jgi:hypothetical protein